ncbi:MAG: chromate transporter, partial [Kiritimatiellae bacterium]|nr:chromate transporter [Kiritimatiellia bacterium]
MTPAARPVTLPALALSCLRVGCLAFGGGLASYPVFRAEFCARRDWLTEDDLDAWFGAAQAVPGVILVNVSATLGLRLAGRPGAAVAAVSAALPAFLCMICLGVLWAGFAENRFVAAALAGLRPAVVALLAAAAVRLARRGIRT